LEELSNYRSGCASDDDCPYAYCSFYAGLAHCVECNAYEKGERLPRSETSSSDHVGQGLECHWGLGDGICEPCDSDDIREIVEPASRALPTESRAARLRTVQKTFFAAMARSAMKVSVLTVWMIPIAPTTFRRGTRKGECVWMARAWDAAPQKTTAPPTLESAVKTVSACPARLARKAVRCKHAPVHPVVQWETLVLAEFASKLHVAQ